MTQGTPPVDSQGINDAREAKRVTTETVTPVEPTVEKTVETTTTETTSEPDNS
jgi:hypothetical protein